MPPVRAILADDEIHLAQHLQSELQQRWPELEILGLARNGLQAAELIAQHAPDLAFLDIQMPGLTGLEVAQGIETDTRVVFVTAFDDFACAAFEQAALDYLLKPLKGDRLDKSVLRLKAHFDTRNSGDKDSAQLAQALQQLLGSAPRGPRSAAEPPLRYIRASQGDLMHQVPVDEVLYFHADEKYTCVQTREAEYLIRTPITELAAQLDGTRFWQVHRSTLINLDHLAGTRRDESSRLFLRFKAHARELPVSRAYVHLFKSM